MDRKQFTFYDSFFVAIKRIRKKQDRADAYDAICSYALYGTEPDLDHMSDSAAIAFTLSKPNLDASRRKAESGKRGGKGKQASSKPEANAKQTQSEKEGEGEKEGEVKIENDSSLPPAPLSGGTAPPEPTPKRTRFVPPSLEEVAAYVRERGSPVDPQAFIDFYAAKGWMVGKSPMKDWRAACRNAESWERWNRAPRSGQGGGGNVFMDMLREEAERRGEG